MECPECGGKELGIGHQLSSYSVMYPSNKLSFVYDVNKLFILNVD